MVIAGCLADVTPIWLEEQMYLHDGIVVWSVEFALFLAVKRWRSIQRQRLTGPSLQMERLTVTVLRMKRALMFLRRSGRFADRRFLPTDTVSLERGSRRAGGGYR